MAGTIAAQQHEAERSPQWPSVRDAFVKNNPQCAVCGKGPAQGIGLQAHHIFPFHYCIRLGRPDLELDPRNLVTLCETESGKPSDDHHVLIGHLDDFESSNLDVVSDAHTRFHGYSAEKIRNDEAWQQKKQQRLPHIEAMRPEDQAAFVWAMNTRYPKAGVPAGKKPASLPDWIPAALR